MGASVRRPRSNPVRRVRILLQDGAFSSLQIAVGKTAAEYLCQRLPTSGRVSTDFEVMRQGPTPAGEDSGRYGVSISAAGEEYDTCTCRGWERWGRCKHAACLRKLVEDRRI